MKTLTLVVTATLSLVININAMAQAKAPADNAPDVKSWSGSTVLYVQPHRVWIATRSIRLHQRNTITLFYNKYRYSATVTTKDIDYTSNPPSILKQITPAALAPTTTKEQAKNGLADFIAAANKQLVIAYSEDVPIVDKTSLPDRG